MLERIVDILKEFTDVAPDDIREETNLINDLGLNSLDVVNIVVAFEDTFGIEIPDEDIPKFVTVGDIVKYLNNI